MHAVTVSRLFVVCQLTVPLLQEVKESLVAAGDRHSEALTGLETKLVGDLATVTTSVESLAASLSALRQAFDDEVAARAAATPIVVYASPDPAAVPVSHTQSSCTSSCNAADVEDTVRRIVAG